MKSGLCGLQLCIRSDTASISKVQLFKCQCIGKSNARYAAWSNEDMMHNIFISETYAMDEPPLKMQKVEQNGKILYLVWPPDGRPPILLNCPMRAQEFLEKENLLSVVPLSRFDFKKPTSENSSPSLSLSSSSPPKGKNTRPRTARAAQGARHPP